MPKFPIYIQPGVEYKPLDTTAASPSNVHTPVTDSVFYVLGIQGSLNTAGGMIWFEDTDATQLTGKMYCAGNTIFGIGPGDFPICKTSSGKGLAVNTATAGFHGIVQFVEVVQ